MTTCASPPSVVATPAGDEQCVRADTTGQWPPDSCSHHRENGSHLLLFVRATKTKPLGVAPYVFLGPADYVSHEGEKPMAITWRPHKPMPAEVYQASTVA